MPRAQSANYSPEAAQRAIDFIACLKHTKGRWRGVPFVLPGWQADRIVKPLFGNVVPNPRFPSGSPRKTLRRYRKAFVTMGKKNGKSGLAAAMAADLLYADGEFGAEVYSGAASRDQATIIYRELKAMVKQVPELDALSQCYDSTKRIYVPSTESFYQALSADADYSDGVNPSGVIVDELHRHKSRELYDLLNEGSGTREQPLIIVITTAGVDQHSVCFEEWQYARQVAADPNLDSTFLPVLYEIPGDLSFDEIAADEKLWYLANPALGDFLDIEDLRKSVREAKQKPAQRLSTMRLRFNAWTQSETVWLPHEDWIACGSDLLTTIEERNRGRSGYGGLDLSSTQDFAAWRIVFPWEDGSRDTVGCCFIPEDTARKRKNYGQLLEWERGGHLCITPGNIIDYEFIEEQIRRDSEKYRIEEIGYDPWGSSQIIVDLDRDGFVMVPVRQGFATLSPPAKLLETYVAKHTLHHGGDPLLAWMAGNVTVEIDAAENIKPSKKKSAERIDGIVALIIAEERAMHYANFAAPECFSFTMEELQEAKA